MKTLTAWQTDPGRGEREQEDIGLLINSGQNYNIKKDTLNSTFIK